MDKQQRDHIIKNIDRLIDCTKDEDTLFTYLLKHKFISQASWETINNTQHNRHSRIREMYLECMKTPKFDLLIQSLKDCDNHQAAVILEEIHATSSFATINAQENLIWFDILQGTKLYKGREKELQTIHNYWLETSSDNSLILVGITGLGGIGKTELARNYAQKFHTEVQGHCIWINAETNTSFLDSFSRLANQMNVSLIDAFGKEKTLQLLTFEVYERLSAKKYMVVFDNLESYEMEYLECFVKYAMRLPPSKAKPFALMTSRYQSLHNIFGELVRHLNLNVLSESSSLSFFEHALNISLENDEIENDLKTLCGILGNLPLAMQQAAAYINARKNISDTKTEIKDYLQSFESERKKMLDYRLSKFMGYDEISKTTFFTWQITLDKLEITPGIGSLAKMALNVMSFLYSDNISVTFLKSILNFCGKSEIDTNINKVDIFEILADYSMCQRYKIDGEIYVAVHRLVQTVTQMNLEEEKWTEMINTLLQIINDNFDSIIPLGNISNIRSLLNNTKNNTYKISNKNKYFKLLKKMLTLYIAIGNYREGCEFNSFAVQQLEELFGKESRLTLLMMAYKGKTLHLTGKYENAQDILQDVHQNQQAIIRTSNAAEKNKLEKNASYTKTVIADVYKDQGNYDKAMEMYLEVLERQQRVLGIEHRETLSTKYKISSIYDHQGNYDKAVEMFLAVLEVQQRILGMEHTDTLSTKNSIALVFRRQGKYDKAVKMYLEVLEVRQRVQGMGHPMTLNTIHNIASVYDSQGHYDKAVKIYLEVLKVKQRVHGMEHPSTLTTKHNIASVYYKQGYYDKAVEAYFEVLEVQQRVLGMEHHDTLATKNGIASVYSSQDNYEKAVEIYLEVWEGSQRVLGMEHPETLTTKNNIAFVYSSQGNYDKAVEIYLEVLEVRNRVLGVEHPETLTTKHNIASVYNSQGNYEKAVEIYLEVLEVRQRVLGMEHPDTMSTKHNVVLVFKKQGNYEKAVEMNLEVLEVQQRVLGMDHPGTLSTKNNIAFLYTQQSNYDKALEMYLEVLDIAQRVLGMEHPNALTIKDNIALVFKSQGNYDKAVVMYLEVLEVQQRVLGMEHSDTLETKYGIASVYDSQGNYVKAMELRLEVLEVLQRVLGMEHEDTLNTKYNIASVYDSQGNYGKAVEMYLEVLEVKQRVLGIEHEDTLRTKHSIALVYKNHRNYNKASEMFLEILEVQQRVLGMEHPDTLDTKHNIVSVYASQGNYDKADEMELGVLETKLRVL